MEITKLHVHSKVTSIIVPPGGACIVGITPVLPIPVIKPFVVGRLQPPCGAVTVYVNVHMSRKALRLVRLQNNRIFPIINYPWEIIVRTSL